MREASKDRKQGSERDSEKGCKSEKSCEDYQALGGNSGHR